MTSPIRRRTLNLAALAGLLVAVLAGLSVYARWLASFGPEGPDGWHQVAWPFPRDGWDEGKAWRGHGLDVYVRPKLGFCGNCDTGVVEDAEVDRVTDMDLVDPLFVPAEPGQRIRITDMVGRARLYRLRNHSPSRLAEAIAVSYRCDLVVAIVVGDVGDEKARQTAHRFLESDKVQFWLNQQLGER